MSRGDVSAVFGFDLVKVKSGNTLNLLIFLLVGYVMRFFFY